MSTRICPRCLVRLAALPDHSVYWCPKCGWKVRLADHADAAVTGQAGRGAGQPPPKPAPASPRPARAVPRPPSPAPAARRTRHALSAPRDAGSSGRSVLVFLGVAVLLGGGLAVGFFLA